MGLDNLPEVPPCENLIKKYPGKAEVVDIPIEYISSEFISSITSREENIGENFEILKHYFPEYHMKVYTVNADLLPALKGEGSNELTPRHWQGGLRGFI